MSDITNNVCVRRVRTRRYTLKQEMSRETKNRALYEYKYSMFIRQESREAFRRGERQRVVRRRRRVGRG